jgi:hypothetical protein
MSVQDVCLYMLAYMLHLQSLAHFQAQWYYSGTLIICLTTGIAYEAKLAQLEANDETLAFSVEAKLSFLHTLRNVNDVLNRSAVLLVFDGRRQFGETSLCML